MADPFKAMEERKRKGKTYAEANRARLVKEVKTRDRFQASHFMRNMIKALEIHPWQNTVEDWQRYYEARIVMAARRAPAKKSAKKTTRKNPPRKKQVPLKERLFIAVRPTGLGYHDRTRQKDGDYAKCAFIPYDTLEPEFYAGCDAAIKRKVVADAKQLRKKSGAPYKVSASGQTVTLGTKRKNPQSHWVLTNDYGWYILKTPYSKWTFGGMCPSVMKFPTKKAALEFKTKKISPDHYPLYARKMVMPRRKTKRN